MNFLTPEDVASKLKVKPTTVYEWLKSGMLPGIKLGRIWRISEDALVCALVENEQEMRKIAKHYRRELATRLRQRAKELES